MEAYQNVTPVILVTGLDCITPKALAIHRVMTMTPRKKKHSSVLLYTFVRHRVLDTMSIHVSLEWCTGIFCYTPLQKQVLWLYSFVVYSKMHHISEPMKLPLSSH